MFFYENKKLELLPKKLLIKTGPVDHADWNYQSGPLGWVQRLRFKLCLALVGKKNFDEILEIGYGSAIFFPELSKRVKKIYGIDIHEKTKEVTQGLNTLGLEAELFSGTAEKLPFKEEKFSAIVAISALEFIPDLDKACKEISRVLKEDGVFYVITPGISPILDFGFNLLTGKKADEDFENRRERVIPTLLKYFKISKQKEFPSIKSNLICLYKAFELKRI